MNPVDNILFCLLGIAVVYSCGLTLSKIKRDLRRQRELNLQVVPAVEVVEAHATVP